VASPKLVGEVLCRADWDQLRTETKRRPIASAPPMPAILTLDERHFRALRTIDRKKFDFCLRMPE
jgi:hypothetical protein